MKLTSQAFGCGVLLFLAVFLVFSPPAHAYVDAGSGSYALQMSIAALFGALFSLKVYWAKVKAFIAALFAPKRGADHAG